jgi:hypothetical protein
MSQTILWTKHVLKRLKERRLDQERVRETIAHPDKRRPGKQHRTAEYMRLDNGQTITAVVQHKEGKKLLVISAWADPPFPGTKDARHTHYYKLYKKAGFLGKFWYTFLRQIGLW